MTARKPRPLIECLSALKDPRRPSNGTLHDFQEMLMILVAATLSDCDTLEEIVVWAHAHETWLRRFLRLTHGIPSQDTFLRVLQLLNPAKFEACFRRWVGGLVTGLVRGIAIDGKTLRGATAGGSPLHMVSAYATELSLVLGQVRTEAKSNEITAIPELLDALDVRGLLVSIDAMGCQKAIAQKIRDLGGDYLLGVKGNQPKLMTCLADAFIDQQGMAEHHSRLEDSHGRVVIQIVRVLPAKDIVDSTLWPDCTTVARVDSIRASTGGAPGSLEQRFYISSRQLSAEEMAKAIRAHWGIENRLHWVLDVNFGEDACRVRKDHAPENLSTLRKIALNLIRSAPPSPTWKKTSLRIQRKIADWDDDFRMTRMGIQPL